MAEIEALGPWFHNLHLPDGVRTMSDHHFCDFPNWKWQEFAGHLPEDMTGWTALDVGCSGGFYSLELARRGRHGHRFQPALSAPGPVGRGRDGTWRALLVPLPAGL